MNWQLMVVAVLLVLATGYLAYRSWRTWFGKGKVGCGGSCGCGKRETAPARQGATLISEDQLLSRLRTRS